MGFVAAERLRALNSDPDVEVLSLPQLTPELMETLSRAGQVLFIDASQAGAPGEIRWRKLVPTADSTGFTHHLSPEALLAGGRLLYGHAPRAVICTITGQDFGLGAPLSPAVMDALEKILDFVVLNRIIESIN